MCAISQFTAHIKQSYIVQSYWSEGKRFPLKNQVGVQQSCLLIEVSKYREMDPTIKIFFICFAHVGSKSLLALLADCFEALSAPCRTDNNNQHLHRGNV